MIFETILVSEEGEFLVPDSIREQMNLKPGEKFLITSSGDSILLKRLVEKTQEDADNFWARVKEPRPLAV
jgi:AbrB family looped-hinge helix DNA binding protein